MVFRKITPLLGLMFCFSAMAQLPTFHTNDVQDQRPNRVAFINANITTEPGITFENATLLVKNNIVEAVGTALQIPAGATVIDCKGKRIYPSLIDIYSDYGMPEVKRGGGQGRRGEPQFESTKKGAYNWNQAIQPENDASNLFVTDPKKADELRKLGFGSLVVHQADGIARGTSAWIALGNGKEQENLLHSRISAHYSFNKGSSTQDNPTSLMGAIALLRQTYLDADWYKKTNNKTEANLSLEAFNQQQSIPQIFEVPDKLGILRADNIGDEFGVQYLIKTSGDEYQRIAEIKATGASLIVPLNFPQAFDVEDPIDARFVSLAEMKHWEMAPANASLLAQAGIRFAFTTAGLKNKSDLWANIRKAMEYNLSEKDALAAFTTIPAQLLRINDKIGTLKTGMLANLLITSDNLFKDGNIIYENWIQGNRFVLKEMNISDIRGIYTLALNDIPNLKLNISGKIETPDVQVIQNDTTKIMAKATRNGNLLTMNFRIKKTDTGDFRLSGWADGTALKGTGENQDGKPLLWSASFKEAIKETPIKTDSTKKQKLEIGHIVYPFLGYGNQQKPQAETVLFKNATVWTNEKEGILPNTDVLVENGKIAKIGKNITISNAKSIDATGKHLTNGILDEHSHIALASVNEGTQSVTAEVRMSDVVNSEDINIYRQLAGGVTTSQLLHGSANCIGGQSAIVKLKWGESPAGMMFPNADPFIKFALGENVKQTNWGDTQRIRFPQTRMGVEQVMIDAFNRAKEYDTEWKKYNILKDKSVANAPRKDLELEALAEILNKKRFITCHSYVQSEINMLMKVAEQFNFNINTFTHILEGYKLADVMKKHGVRGASTFSDWWAYKNEVKEAIPFNAALMARVGLNVSINSDDAEMARRLNQEAAKTILYGGIAEEDAWKMITLNPAKMLHLDSKIGSIRLGKDADLVLWNQNPLSIYAKPEKTMIDGAIYFDMEQDLRKREDISAERNRLIQKMLAAKAGGLPTQKPQAKVQKMRHCEDFDDYATELDSN